MINYKRSFFLNPLFRKMCALRLEIFFCSRTAWVRKVSTPRLVNTAPVAAFLMHGSKVLISAMNEQLESKQKLAARPTISFRTEASHSSTSNVTVEFGWKAAGEVRKMFAHVTNVPS
jgi:hypothetical protein